MRDFIANEEGRTLAEAMEAYRWDQASGEKTTIESQFEYNAFTRAYYAENPGASRNEVIKAWEVHRNTPKSQR